MFRHPTRAYPARRSLAKFISDTLLETHGSANEVEEFRFVVDFNVDP